MINKLIFCFTSLFIIISEYVCYKYNANYDEFIIKIIDRLAAQNIFYIKIIQALSTNSVLFSSKLIEYMRDYTDNVPYTNDDINYECLTDIYKYNLKNPNQKLNIIFDKPIKSGTVSLVYEGYYNNRKVAIKIIRKDMQYKIIPILDNMDLIIKIISKIPALATFNLYELFKENNLLFIEQTDFKKEISNIKTIYNNYKNNNNIHIPKVYSKFTKLNSNMIVMDFITGKKINEIEKTDAETYYSIIAKFGLKNLLFNRLYHADLHPGNILFLKNNKNECEIGVIDFGIMGEITKQHQNQIYNFMMILCGETINYHKLSNEILLHYIEPQFILQNLNKSIIAYLEVAIANIIERAIQDNGHIGAQELFNINKILIKYNLKLARYFCKIILAAVISESVTFSLGINCKIYNSIKTIVNELFPTDLIDY